jgi:hypothetical protein
LFSQAIPPPPPPPPPPGVFSQQPQTNEPEQRGTGILLGQVVDASTRRPIAGAVVILSGLNQIVATMPDGMVIVPPTPGAARGPRQVIASSAGRFVFHGLAAGTYQLHATAPGYLTGAFGSSRPGAASGATVELERGDEKKDGLVLALWKAASISGTVLDELGEPVIGAPVRAFQRIVSGGRTRLQPYLTGTTDDRGMYRILNLPPGEYYFGISSSSHTMPASTADAYYSAIMSGGGSADISRELSSSGLSIGVVLGNGYRAGDFVVQNSALGRPGGSGLALPPPADDGRMMVYGPQYFPAATTIGDATLIKLASGEHRPGVDLSMRLVPALRVTGTLTGPEGAMRNIGLRLFAQGADDFTTESGNESASTVSDATGAFTFLGVTPGVYTLKVLRVARPIVAGRGTSVVEFVGAGGVGGGISVSGRAGGAAPLPPEPTLWAIQQVTVAGEDVHGLAVTLRSGNRISGRIEFDGGRDKPAPELLARTALSITPAGGAPVSTLITGAAKRVESDGQFNTVGYPPGTYLITVTIPAPNWYLRDVTLGGRDVSTDGLVVAGEDITGVVATFTDRTQTIEGTVRNGRGEPDHTASVVVIPADSDAWKRGVVSTRRIRLSTVSTTGMFRLAGLPAGRYYIVAASADALENYQTPERLEALTRAAATVTLEPGTTLTQTLRTQVIR